MSVETRLAGYAAAYRDLFTRLRAAKLMPDGPHRVLDAGAGTGVLAAACARASPQPGTFYAVDLSPRSLARARASWNARRCRLETATGDIANLAFPSRSFDVVMSAHCLERTENPAAAIAELGRVLRPGGLLLMVIGRGGWLDTAARVIGRYQAIGAWDVFAWMWNSGVAPVGRVRFGRRGAPAYWLSEAVVGKKRRHHAADV